VAQDLQWLNVLVGLFGIAAFAGIALLSRSRNKSRRTADEATVAVGAEIV